MGVSRPPSPPEDSGEWLRMRLVRLSRRFPPLTPLICLHGGIQRITEEVSSAFKNEPLVIQDVLLIGVERRPVPGLQDDARMLLEMVWDSIEHVAVRDPPFCDSS